MSFFLNIYEGKEKPMKSKINEETKVE